MKKKMIAVFMLLIASVQSCKKESSSSNDNTSGISDYEGGEQQKVSRYNSLASHNSGTNCVTCHKTGGQGEGVFTVAGSVYDTTQLNTYPNATIKLYTGANGTGTLKYTIEVDGRGNFYTTNALDFSTPLYPAVVGSTSTQYMSTSISLGACMNCHNNTTGKIWAK